MAVQSMKWLLKNWYALTATQLRKLNDYDNLRNQYNSVKSRADQFYIGRQINCNQGIHRWLINGLAISEDTTMTMIPSGRVTGQLSYNGSMFVTTDSDWFKVSDILQGGVSASLTHVYHALTAFREKVRSMIDHMIVDLKKYYQSQMPNYVGRKIRCTSLPLTQYAFPLNENGNGYIGLKPSTGSSPDLNNWTTVIGQAFENNSIYLLIYAEAINDNTGTAFPFWIKLSDLIQNGGVRHSLLVRVYHVVSRLGRRLAWQ